MSLADKITTRLAVVVVAGLVTLAVSACTAGGLSASPAGSESPAPHASATAVTDDGTATPAAPLTELPEWALATVPWLIYPEGFMCTGTEGCPNDYRAAFGEPAEVLPEHVEYYDPAVHVWVFPADR